jgi:hypothetical protein
MHTCIFLIVASTIGLDMWVPIYSIINHDVYLCTDVYVLLYMYTHIYTYIYMYVYIHTYLYVDVCTEVHMSSYIYNKIHINIITTFVFRYE